MKFLAFQERLDVLVLEVKMVLPANRDHQETTVLQVKKVQLVYLVKKAVLEDVVYQVNQVRTVKMVNQVVTAKALMVLSVTVEMTENAAHEDQKVRLLLPPHQATPHQEPLVKKVHQAIEVNREIVVFPANKVQEV